MLHVPVQPAFGTPLSRGRLRKGIVCALLFNGGTTFRDYSGIAGDFIYTASSTNLDFGHNEFGRFTEFTVAGANNFIQSGIVGDGKSAWVPASNLTAQMCFQKSDGSNRSAQFCGIDVGLSGSAFFMNMHIPFSDGVVYWDLGGNSGGNRLSVGGLTFGTDNWIFTAGPRGQEIWQNGILRASNSNNPTRSTDSTMPFKFGANNFQVADLVRMSSFVMWNYQLEIPDVLYASTSPYAAWETATQVTDLGRMSLLLPGDVPSLHPYAGSRPLYKVAATRWG